MSRIKSKKLIAVICCLCVLVSVFSIKNIKTKAEAPKTVKTEIGKDFKKVTLSDLGVDNTDKTTAETDFWLSADDKNNVKKLDKLLFSAYIVFNNTTGTNKGTELHFATQQGGDTGIAFSITSKNGKNLSLSRIKTPGPSISKVFYPNKAGLDGDTFNGTSFLLQISTEFYDSDGDGDDDDLKLGVFFNGLLYENSYITIRNASSSTSYKMGCRVNFNGESGEIYSVKDPVLLKDTPDASFKYITLSDCGVSDGSTENMSMKLPVDSFDKTLFNLSLLMNCSGNNSTQLHFLAKGANDNGGLTLWINNDSDHNLHFGTVSGSSISGVYDTEIFRSVANIKGNTFNNNRFILRISTELVDHHGDGKKDDLKIGLFIGEQLYNSTYLYYDNIDLSKIGTYVTFTGIAGEAYSIKPAISLDKSDSADFKLISLNDLGIFDGKGDVSGKYGESFDKTVLGMNVKFEQNGTRLHYGPSKKSAYSGIGIRLDSNKLIVSCEAGTDDIKLTNLKQLIIDPSKTDIGADTFLKTEFVLHISTEFGEFGGDADQKDIKLGLFINGNLYDGSYVYIYDQANRLTDNFNFNEGGNNKSYSSIDTPIKTLPTNLKEITLIDARMGDGSGNAAGKFIGLNSLDGTLFSAKLKFSKNLARMHYGLSNEYKDGFIGIGFRLEDDKLIIGNEQGSKEGALSSMKLNFVTIDPVKAGVGKTFVDTEFLLQVSIEFIDRDNDGENNDIKLGVFINGVMYKNSYFYISNQAGLLGTRINFNEGGAASFASYEKGPKLTPKDLKANPTYTELTLRDFVIKDRIFSGNTSKYAIYDNNTFDSTAFSANIKFSSEKAGNCAVYIGGTAWSGLRIEARKDGSLAISHLHIDGTQTWLLNLDPEKAGISSFVDNAFNIRLTFDVIKNNSQYSDYLLGVYINGKLYGDEFVTAKCVEAATLQRTIFIYTVKEGSIEIKSLNNKVDFTIFGFDNSWKKTLTIS